MRFSSTLLFAATALIGLFVAYDMRVGMGRFALILLGLTLAAFLTLIGRMNANKTVVGYLAYGLLWGTSLLGGAYLFAGGLVSSTDGIEFAWQLNNGVGGALAALIPIGVSALIWLGRRWRRERENGAGVLAIAGVIPAVVALAALLATGSRGALIGFAVGGATALYLAWRAASGQTSSWRWLGDSLLVLILLTVVAGYLWLLFAPNALDVAAVFTSDSSAASRPALWRDALSLVEDYRFTGGGLGGTGMIFSTYLFLLHVGYLYHAHSLYLQIALEQGLPGLIAFGSMAAASLWLALRALHTGRTVNALLCGAIAGLIALLVHGLVEAELYATALAPLLFLPFGFLWALQPTAGVVFVENKQATVTPWLRAVVVGLTPFVLVLPLFLLPGARAAFQANLGAVAQTKAELSQYAWPKWPIQDALRRDPSVNLEGAIARYKAALRLDPDNTTSLRRLGQIALSRGEPDAARSFLERADLRSPGQRVTRQLLGEVYALQGDADAAATLWASIDTSQGQLELRRWWVGQIGTRADADALTQALARLHLLSQKTNP